ncbi:hypothetical protein NBRC111894_2170 [Sporolactobacillus inulinus]|uniref:Uncharacterized protein n=1 Tax=Sporolactobacillus inulinus TaxID=2078 RepID=A0A4Y1ZBZ3_9BACL|nr:hypothetical protein [Sporolactobacillus inulinus]GAY76616.1 hypothetical protein NBRC111894_2170 [Sporolactobacillus inulinus]
MKGRYNTRSLIDTVQSSTIEREPGYKTLMKLTRNATDIDEHSLLETRT